MRAMEPDEVTPNADGHQSAPAIVGLGDHPGFVVGLTDARCVAGFTRVRRLV